MSLVVARNAYPTDDICEGHHLMQLAVRLARVRLMLAPDCRSQVVSLAHSGEYVCIHLFVQSLSLHTPDTATVISTRLRRP